MSALEARRVLVTGATGFIGGRLVEQLVRVERANVRALVRNFARAPRLARFAVEMMPGDLTSPDDVDRAVAGCDTIFHCAYGNVGDDGARRAVTVAGTERLLAAALRHRVRRLVHVSTFSVYGDPLGGDLVETAPRKRTGAAYGDSKIDAEALALAYCDRGLSVSVVQPTIVYGPYATTWIVKPLEQFATGRIVLINGGNGACNAVYVDDVVAAMVRAAAIDAAHGETFLISGGDEITWAQFFARLGQLVPSADTVSMTPDQAREHYRRSAEPGVVSQAFGVLRREIGRRDAAVRAQLSSTPIGRAAIAGAEMMTLLPRPDTSAPSTPAAPIHPVLPGKIAMFASTARVRIEKAARLLGYRPAYDFARGMDVTEAWARWANLA